jgi:hypothetical protein
LAFECKAPCTPCCVVLGSVEVEDGKIVRVCNCEREYVWSFANFVEVLLYTVLQGGACHPPAASLTTRDQANAPGVQSDCCPSITVDSSQFGILYQLDPRVREYAGQTFMTAIRTAKESLQQSYQFTAQGVISPKLFEQKPLQNVAALVTKMGLTGVRQVQGTPPTDFLSRMVASTLIQQGEQLAVFTDSNGIITFAGGERAPSFSTHPVGVDSPVSSPANVQDLQQQVESLKASHAELSAKLAELQTAMKTTPVASPGPPQVPAENPAPPAAPSGNPEAPHGGS